MGASEKSEAAWHGADVRREEAWRRRYPDVARSPLYDKGWADAMATAAEPELTRDPYAGDTYLRRPAWAKTVQPTTPKPDHA